MAYKTLERKKSTNQTHRFHGNFQTNLAGLAEPRSCPLVFLYLFRNSPLEDKLP